MSTNTIPATKTNGRNVSPIREDDDFEDPPAHLRQALRRAIGNAAAAVGAKVLTGETPGDELQAALAGLDEKSLAAIRGLTAEALYERSPHGRGAAAVKAGRDAALDSILSDKPAIERLADMALGAVEAVVQELGLTGDTECNPWRKGYLRHTVKPQARRGHPMRGKFVITGELCTMYPGVRVTFHPGWGRQLYVASITARGGEDQTAEVAKFGADIAKWCAARRHTW
jgi:hypothetical protein